MATKGRAAEMHKTFLIEAENPSKAGAPISIYGTINGGVKFSIL